MGTYLKLIVVLQLAGVLAAGEADTVAPPKVLPPAVPLELKLTSHRAHYAVDRGGKSAAEYAAFLKSGNNPYGPAVVIMIELHNKGDKDLIAYGAPRPQFELKGPRAESVCEVAPTQFQSAPSRRYALPAGKSIFLNVISFCNPDKDEPSVKDTIKRLSYSEGCALRCVNWTEPGEYTLSAVLPIGVSPAPEKAEPFQKGNFAFPKVPDDIGMARLESNAVKLTIQEGSDTNYWIEALDDPDAEVRFVAAHTLTAALPLSEPARLKMAAHINDSDARVRKSAARASQRPESLGNADSEALSRDPAVVGLIQALNDSNAGVRVFAIAALGTWGRGVKSTTTALIPLLQDKDAGVRLAAADALGDMYRDGAADDPALVQALIGTLKDSDEQVATSAIVALGRLKSTEGTAALIPYCAKASAGIARAAIEGIGDSGRATPDAEAALFAALKIPATRSVAAAALGKLKADSAKLLPELTAALKLEENEFGRIAIVRALGTCGEPAVPVLQSVLKNDAKSSVREYAEAALKKIQSAGQTK